MWCAIQMWEKRNAITKLHFVKCKRGGGRKLLLIFNMVVFFFLCFIEPLKFLQVDEIKFSFDHTKILQFKVIENSNEFS